MPRNGAGSYSLPAGNPVVTGTVISSTVHNSTMQDVATALTNSIAKDGQTVPTADLPMGGNKHTAVGDASARNQYPSVAQIQDAALTTLGSVAGTDTITGSLTPSVATSGLTAGMVIGFIPAETNTGAVTLNVNSIGAEDVQKFGATALVAGDLAEGVPALLMYDGSAFQLLNPQKLPDSALSNNVPLKDAANEYTAPQLVYIESESGHWRIQRPENDEDEKNWHIGARSSGSNGAALWIRAVSDSSFLSGNTLLVATRSGTSITRLTLNADTLDFNGDADISGTLDVGGILTSTVNGQALGSGIQIVADSAWMRFSETDQGSDEKEWAWGVTSKQYRLLTRADNGDPGATPINVLRGTGTAVSEIELNADTLDFNGDVDISGETLAPTIANSTSETLVPGQIHHVDGNCAVPTLTAGQWVAIVNHSGSAITLSRRGGTALYWTQTGEDSATVTIGARGRVVVSCAATGSDYVSGNITGNTT